MSMDEDASAAVECETKTVNCNNDSSGQKNSQLNSNSSDHSNVSIKAYLINYSNSSESQSTIDDSAFVRFDEKLRRVSWESSELGSHSREIDPNTNICQLNDQTLCLQFSGEDRARILKFSCPKAAKIFFEKVRALKSEIISKNHDDSSIFDQRTEESSAVQYFQFYGYLSQQQNMLQDYVRTYTYQRAVLSNLDDFKNKVILDVGAGSGILSFFAAQAGARRVYAVEASSMAQSCETLVKSNNMDHIIKVLAGKIEDIELPEKVDLIISEPMGYMLLNERMLETFLHAKKFLKQGGKMFPTKGDLHIAPFTDEALFLEQCSKANFWWQNSFHGVNLTCLAPKALKEYFRQPVVDTFHPAILMARSCVWTVDFEDQNEHDLHQISIPLEFVLTQTGHIHGLAFWFDVAFLGSSQPVYLSTAPTEPLTHWYQVRCLLDQPLMAYKGWAVTGRLSLTANKRQSYDVDIELCSAGRTLANSLDLKNPCFRYTGQPVMPPPGQHATSPSEAYWNTTAAAGTMYNAQQPQQQHGASMDRFLVDQSACNFNGGTYAPVPPESNIYRNVPAASGVNAWPAVAAASAELNGPVGMGTAGGLFSAEMATPLASPYVQTIDINSSTVSPNVGHH